MSTGKQTYRIPLVWQEYGHVDVEAGDLKEAVEYALGPECPLPEGNYVDGSVEIDFGASDLLKQAKHTLIEDSDDSYDTLLWKLLLAHRGHRVSIVSYGDPADPANVSLECEDCGEVILDAEINTTCAREDK